MFKLIKPKMLGNDFSDIIKDIMFPEAFGVLEESATISSLVFVDSSVTATSKGKTVDITLPVDMGSADDFVKGVGAPTTDLEARTVSILIDQHKTKQFLIDDMDLLEIEENLVLPSAVKSSINSLGNSVNDFIYSNYKDVPYISGTDSTASFDYSVMSNAEAIMFDNLAPKMEPKFAVVNSKRHQELANDLSKLNYTEGTESLRKAVVGEVSDFTVFRDQLIKEYVHTNGTAKDDTLTAQPAVSGSESITVDGASAGSTVKKGDILQITLVSSKLQSVSAAADAVESGGSITISLAQPLKDNVAALASVSYVNNEDSYDVNLGFQSNFFALVVRPIADAARSFGNTSALIVSQTDERTGLSLKLEAYRDSDTNENKWRWEILFGGKVVRPELAVRILGS